MKHRLKFNISLLLVLVIFTTLYSQVIPDDCLYLGQTHPGETPKLFLKGMAEGRAERIAISPEGKEIYFNDNIGINYYNYSNNKWNGPTLLFKDYFAPALSPDGKTLYFQKNENNITQSYFSVINDTGWSMPLNFWSTPKLEHYLQVTNTGNYYFTTNPQVSINGDISKLIIKGSDTTIQSLKRPINGYNGVDFFISRDESYIIFVMRRNFGTGFGDLNISYHKKDDSWTNPKNLGNSINILSNWQWGPYVSPDNKYLFFTSALGGRNPSIYWVKVDRLIDSLKYTNFIPYIKNPIPNQKAVKDLKFNYQIPNSIFVDDDGNNTLTYSATLSNGKPLPGWLSFNSTTRTLFGDPNKIEVDSIKITATDTAGARVSAEFTITVTVPSIDYFGQTPPEDSAVVFASGIISLTDRLENSLTFSPDGNECFISVWGPNYSNTKIYWTKRVGNEWTVQMEAPFSVGHFASRPFFSLDGSRLYFHYANYSGPESYNIWMVQRTPPGWGEPIHLPSPINSNFRDGSYSETAAGTVYFTSNRRGGYDNKGDIWRTRKVPGQPLQVENLGNIVNSSAWDGDSYVSPDGSFLIFTSERPGGYGSSDIYITYKKDDGDWTQPVDMERNGNGINIKNTATVGPSISPDGKFLFFSHWAVTATSETADIYWISTKVIDDIKKEVFNPKIAK